MQQQGRQRRSAGAAGARCATPAAGTGGGAACWWQSGAGSLGRRCGGANAHPVSSKHNQLRADRALPARHVRGREQGAEGPCLPNAEAALDKFVKVDAAGAVGVDGLRATRRVRLVRGEGRGVSDWYGVRDAACPLSTKGGAGAVRRARSVARRPGVLWSPPPPPYCCPYPCPYCTLPPSS